MSDFEDLIREAQQRQAARAVDPDRLLAALPARRARMVRRRRYQTVGIAAAAVVVSATLAVPMLALGGGSVTGGGAGLRVAAPPPAKGSPSPAASTPAPVRMPVVVDLRYSPTWLPPGLTERIRQVPVGTPLDPQGGPSREWTNQRVGTDDEGGSTGLTMQVRVAQGADDPQPNDGVPVDVNGGRGFYHGPVTGEGSKSYVEFRVGDDVVLVGVNRLSLSEQDLLRVARSVRPDPVQLRVPLRLGWLPDGLTPTWAEVSGDSPTSWLAKITAQAADVPAPSVDAGKPGVKEGNTGGSEISVYLSPTTTAPAGGDPLTVGGHPARLVTRTDLPGLHMQYLVVQLGGGEQLTVIGDSSPSRPLTQDDLVRVAQNATQDDPPDTAWINIH